MLDLWGAIQANDPAAAETLLRAGVDPNRKDPLGYPPLSIAVDGVRRALREGADPNEMAVDGHTPLLDAAREGHADVVAELLAAGSDVGIVDHLMKATPGHKAAYMGHAEATRLLIEEGRLDLGAQGPYNGYTALHDATWHGHFETARILLEAGARTDLKGLDGRTVQEMAREYGYDELVTLLAGG